MKLSYGITVHNEHEELNQLLELLIHNCKIYGINPDKWIKMLNEVENKDKNK